VHAVLLALLLSLGTLLPAHADTALIGVHDSGRSLNAHVELLMDPGAELKVTDLQRPEVQARFQPAQGRPASARARTPGGFGSRCSGPATRRLNGGWKSAR
jgi:two-component system, sensor histidine kinase LadS